MAVVAQLPKVRITSSSRTLPCHALTPYAQEMGGAEGKVAYIGRYMNAFLGGDAYIGRYRRDLSARENPADCGAIRRYV